MAYRALEKLINLHDGYRRAFRSSRGDVLLLQHDGQPRLISRHCPHRGHPLDVAPIEADCITCPLHQMSFSLETGEARSGDCQKLQVLGLIYEGNTLGLDE